MHFLGALVAVKSKLCFIVGPIGAKDSPEWKRSDKVRRFIIDPAIAHLALTPIWTFLLDSVGSELHSTEMYFTVFHGVFDWSAHTLTWASAGHPYAFRVPRNGPPERLGATCPPLGLVPASEIAQRCVAWHDGDLLCLWTDGLVDARDDRGTAYGEARLLESLVRLRESPVEEIVCNVLADADAWAAHPADDRTLLVLRR